MNGQPARPSAWLDAACLAAGALVTVYLVARAILVPLTYDEAATLVRYVERDAVAVFDFNVATNHFLNTVATKLSHGVFGDAPWALRLPNVIAGIAFLWAAAALARRASSPLIGFAGFVLLAFNPYLLDYLALSRGYGLAVALLMVSLLYLARWLLDLPPGAPDAGRALRRCLWIGAAAVLASFTVLAAWLALLAIVMLRLAWQSRTGAASAPSPAGRLLTWRAAIAWLLVSTAFSVLVFSRQQVLAPDLFTPIAVRVTGVLDEELDEVRVYRESPNGRFRELQRGPDNEWRTGDNAAAWGLRVELPASLDRNLASLDVSIGAGRFTRDRRNDGPWQVLDRGTERVLRSTPALSAPRAGIPTIEGAINWAGDRGQWLTAARWTAVLGAGLPVLAVAWAMTLIGMTRLRLLDAAHARLLFWPPLTVAGLLAAPLYLLRRDAQLYFGGRSGLFADTFGSLLSGTTYGSADTTVLLPFALALLAAAIAVLLLAAAFVPHTRRALAVPAAFITVVVLVVAQVVAQHALLDTPFLQGRTALFLLPLLIGFAFTLADALARGGGPARAAATLAMIALASAAIWHGAAVANTTRTLDWPGDATTPAMLAAVTQAVEDEGAGQDEVRIGVEWMFYPVARYYASHLAPGPLRIIVEVADDDHPRPDFLYTEAGSRASAGEVVQAFAESRAVLWRLGPATGTR